jgi:hypothetical protein
MITQEGLEKLREELGHLTTAKRREVAERIKEAREFGDIMENAEYDDAKNEQAMLEQRIAQLRPAAGRDRQQAGRTEQVAPMPSSTCQPDRIPPRPTPGAEASTSRRSARL